jgi:hypothetical protein
MTVSIFGLAIGAAQAGELAGGWGGQRDCCCPPTRIKRPPPPPTVGVVYPICFYDVELGAVETARLAWPQYSKKLEAVLLGRVQNRKRVTVTSSRSAVAWATKYTHRQIASVWPEIACIGQSGGETSEQRRKTCVKFVGMVLKSNVEKTSMPAGAPEPVCQTFLASQ